MIEKTAVIRQFVVQKFESGKHARPGLCAGDIAALVGDAESGQPESGSRDAGNDAIVGAGFTRVTTIFYQPGFGTRLFPKIATRQAFDIIE